MECQMICVASIMLVLAGTAAAAPQNCRQEVTPPGQAAADFGRVIESDGVNVAVADPSDSSQVSDGGAVHLFAIEPFTERLVFNSTIRPIDPTPAAQFGAAAAIDGDLAVVGAPGAAGIRIDSGAVYVFERTGGAWQQAHKLVDPIGESGDLFGESVALANGRIFVGAPGIDQGAPNVGAVLVFEQAAGSWHLTDTLNGGGGRQYGRALSASGDFVAVSGAAPSRVDVVHRNSQLGLWVNEASLASADCTPIIDGDRLLYLSSSTHLSVAERDLQSGLWAPSATLPPRFFAFGVGDFGYSGGTLSVTPETVWPFIYRATPNGWEPVPLAASYGSSAYVGSPTSVSAGRVFFGVGDPAAYPEGGVLSLLLGCLPFAGTVDCEQVAANSTGSASEMYVLGDRSVAASDMQFSAAHLPLESFAMFIGGRSSGLTVNPGGSEGNLCLSGAIGRFDAPGQIRSSGLFGFVGLSVDLAALPTPNGTVVALPGETWFFQAWHRDIDSSGASSSNFTNSVRVLFTQ